MGITLGLQTYVGKEGLPGWGSEVSIQGYPLMDSLKKVPESSAGSGKAALKSQIHAEIT